MTELDMQHFTRRPFPIRGVRVTGDNMEDVAKWCGGTVLSENVPNRGEQSFIKVEVQDPKSERQKKAFVGDWVTYGGQGYKVYTDKGLRKTFDMLPPAPGAANVFSTMSGAPIAVGNSGAGEKNWGTVGKNPGGTH